MIQAKHRLNDKIRAPKVRLIGANGEQVGIVDIRDAQIAAEAAALDLVEVAPLANPPVCRILDYGKFKYEQQKKDQASRDRHHQVRIKELRLRPTTDENDLNVKLKQARGFLEKKNKVLFKMRFRGRELAHQQLGQELLKRIADALTDVSTIELPPKMEGRQMNMMLNHK